MPKVRETYGLQDWYQEFRQKDSVKNINEKFEDFDYNMEWLNVTKPGFKAEYKGMSDAVAESMREVYNDLSAAWNELNGHFDALDPYEVTRAAEDFYRGENRVERKPCEKQAELCRCSAVMDECEAKLNALSKTAKSMIQDTPLNLSESEKAYMTEALRGKNIDPKLLNGAALRTAGYGEFKPLTFDKAEEVGITSISDWKKANNSILSQVFDYDLVPKGEQKKTLYKLGINDYMDTIYINGQPMKEYYEKNPLKKGNNREDMKADVIRKLLNSTANIEVASFDSAYNVHVSTLTAESIIPDKQGVFSRSTNAKENEKYKEFYRNGAEARQARHESIKYAAGSMLTAERVSRALMFDKHEMLTQISEKEKEASTAKINEITKESPEVKINPMEIQLYVLSNDYSINTVMSPDRYKEEKEELAREYIDLVKNSNTPEGAQALQDAREDMKLSLAKELKPDENLSKGSHVIRNLDKIKWLNEAAAYCAANFADIGPEEHTKAVNNLYNVTTAQINYAGCYEADKFAFKPIESSRDAYNQVETGARSKLFLEDYSARVMELDNPQSIADYSVIDTKEYDYLYDIRRNINPGQAVSTETLKKDLGDCMNWLEDKGDRRVYVMENSHFLLYSGFPAVKFPNADLHGNEYGMNRETEQRINRAADRLINMPAAQFANHDLADEIDKNEDGLNNRMKMIFANKIKENPVYLARDKYMTDLGYKNGNLDRELDQRIAEAVGAVGAYNSNDEDITAMREAPENLAIMSAYRIGSKLEKEAGKAMRWTTESDDDMHKGLKAINEWIVEKRKESEEKLTEAVNNARQTTPVYAQKIEETLNRDKEQIGSDIQQKSFYGSKDSFRKIAYSATIKRFKDFISNLTKKKETVRQVSISDVAGKNGNAKAQTEKQTAKTEPVKTKEKEAPSMGKK